MGGRKYKFIDLFAGCGGLSLGLAEAGLRGQFAVERDEMAFATFAKNFLHEGKPVTPFRWPSWLAKTNWGIEALLEEHSTALRGLRGRIDVLAGGPPCQGFSFAGRRQEHDPRNLLFEKYVEFVDLLQPQALLLENVPGMKVAHGLRVVHNDGTRSSTAAKPPSFYERLEARLEVAGYTVIPLLLDASDFGVPQKRQRLVVFGLRNDLLARSALGIERFADLLEKARIAQIKGFGLPDQVSAKSALSDLESVGDLIPCTDSWSPSGYQEIRYNGPVTAYQRLMNPGYYKPNSMRLAQHRPDISDRFAEILASCRRGVRMDDVSRRAFGLKKQRIFPMAELDPAPTVTTLPDDILHYSEPRILTVRECARLQSFPDWFDFVGKFTTGGDRRTRECPRYTQVGNAVPPFLGRALGVATRKFLDEVANSRESSTESEYRLIAAN